MRIPVLDHGYVEFIEAWGHGKAAAPQFKELDNGSGECGYDMEAGIIEAARQSTQGSFRGWEPAPCDCTPSGIPTENCCSDCSSRKNRGDAKLLEFLYSHKHFTPFEFAGMVIEVQAPIFVFREWHRHRTQSYNEMSARYAPLPDLYYMPDVDRVLRTGGANKQAQSAGVVAGEVEAIYWRNALKLYYNAAEEIYNAALSEGIPKELARLSMPVGHYSRMRASANLRNWLAFMTLRCDPNAQWEIQQFAGAVNWIIAKTFPRTAALWKEEMERS